MKTVTAENAAQTRHKGKRKKVYIYVDENENCAPDNYL